MKLFSGLLMAVTAFTLSACTMATPFSGPGYEKQQGVTLTGEQTVWVGLTQAILHENRKNRTVFWDHVAKVETSLQNQPGFIGYSKRVELLGNNAWTMTVWNSEAEMNAFVRGQAHQAAIREGYSALQGAKFARITLKRDEIPLSWEQALQVLATQGRSY